jgi:hypothetical protein
MNMPGSINDPEFDRVVTLREAYLIMDHFVSAHLERGELQVGELLGYLGVNPDGKSGDPAALGDFLASTAAVRDASEMTGS